MVVITMHVVDVAMIIPLSVGGLSRFGITPTGGFPAGPFNKACIPA